jgi:hypothetical protein
MTLTHKVPLVADKEELFHAQRQDLVRGSRAAAAVVQLGQGPGEVRSLGLRGEVM